MTSVTTQSTPIQVTEKLTFEEFIQKYMDVHAELVNGKIQIRTPASSRHQDLVRWFMAVFSKILTVARQFVLI